jgi:tetratricopeptide (TPR) repeat protein
MKHLILCGCVVLASACAGAPPTPEAPAPLTPLEARLQALQARPDDEQLLQDVVDVAIQEQQLPRVLAALESREDALGLWFRGRVLYAIASSEGGVDALTRLDAAMACFEASSAKNPVYGDSSEQWLAMCLGKKGNVAFALDDIANAERWLLEATRLRPDRIGVDLGNGDSVKLGLLRVGDRTMRDFAKTEAFFRTAASIADPDVDLLNNAAVYARDLGVRLEKAGKREEARSMLERSYATYLHVLSLDPRSVRLRNDCALVAIHHLEKDWDESRALLDAAIADGEAQLRESPPADARQRRDLDEAVGDCWENLALWHLKHDQDAAAAESAARRSLAHYPLEKRSGARRHLEAAQQLRARAGSDAAR